MNQQTPNWRTWRHVTKLDPDRPLDSRTLDAVYDSGTDAIMVGGSTGMTQPAVSSLLDRLKDSPVPVALEVSTVDAAMMGPDLFFIPLVLNSRQGRWVTGAQSEALAQILPSCGPWIPWQQMIPEAYLVLNPESTAAKVSDAEAGLDKATATAYAAFACQVMRLPLLYIEYSGTFGDMDLLRAVKDQAGKSHLIYGGGITCASQAAQAAALADTVVVGNLVYQDVSRLQETVDAIR